MDQFMKEAINEAMASRDKGGIPIGSVLVKNGKIIGRGHNLRVQDDDPLAHAEISCMRDAGRIGSYADTVLYSTLMPCYLCAGAVVQFGIKKVVAGESETFEGAQDFLRSKGVEVVDLDISECKMLMKEFILEYPELWNEDIGKSAPY
ncbi:MAG: cytosine deaminase [Methanohalophilus sp. T328-1]|uniref:Cytosine deaminase n=2 Tax=Methanohalophilus TaxID=2175 RepID=A0A285GE28_9EURY|nr:MAG: cytosine deaminase [Methanohalophilus sp. T328-1]ODV49006.1 MAG: cytosine deaminase [Methanohalophilus sp. 2-GBenrich]PQV42519.1 cytosine deaminase [Methanohalophilus euhalobius]RSD35322.1 MAG: cytosine deaminase [Methanohalophilus sp.]RXG34027.1 cytosine deaminase [Methanohalophilus sp. WG1-DM]